MIDLENQKLVAGKMTDAFPTEAYCNTDYQFGTTTKRSDWGCLQHMVDLKPASYASYGLHPGNCISYHSGRELLQHLEALSLEEECQLHDEAWAWACRETTRQAARLLVKAFGLAWET